MRSLRTIIRLTLTVAVIALSMGCAGDALSVRANRAAGPPAVAISATHLDVIGSRGTGPRMFVRPSDISTNALGQVFVCDTGNDRIQMFSTAGEYIGEIGGFGWGPQQLNAPTGVSAAASLDVWVADTQNRRIVHLDSRLNWLGVVERETVGTKSRDLGFPTDVAESDEGMLWFVDRDTDRLRRLSPFPETTDRTAEGIGVTELANPSALAICPDGTIVVADTENDRIVLFDMFGTYLRSWGGNALSRPSGVTCTRFGDIVIADTGNHRIVFLNRLGRQIGELGARGMFPGEFQEPRGVTFDRSGRLWVADTGNDRLQVFSVTRATE